MPTAKNNTLNHVYGIAGIVMGIIGLIAALKAEAPWSEYALFGSGWLAAAAYAGMLFYAFKRAEETGEELGHLRQVVDGLKKELSNRSATLDYIASLQMGRAATPRTPAAPDATQAAEEGEA